VPSAALISLLLSTVSLAQTITGHVTNSATSVDIPAVTVNLIRSGQVAYSAATDSQGRFRIDRIQPGIYTAHYTARGFSPIPNFLVDTPGGPFQTGPPDATGAFQIPNVYPGPYRILPGPAPPRYYLDSVRLGAYDALDSAVEIAPGLPPLTIVYKFGGGTVRGQVENCASGTVRLLPRDKSLWREGFLLFAPCDSNDRYEFTAVRPGEYSILAIAGDTPTPWYATTWDDDALVKNASTVTVRAGESSSVDLRTTQQ
jgi:hypothetical protein